MELATIKNANVYDLALTSRKIVDLQKTEAVPPIIDAVSKVYYELGQNAPGNSPESQAKNIQLLAVSLWREVKEYFPFLRQEEVALAFKAGARGEYGDFFGINLITFHKWLKGYQMDAKRLEARRRVEEAKKVEYAPVMSKDEAEYSWRQIIKARFDDFKKTGIFYSEHARFEFLEFEKRGILVLSEEEKAQIYSRAVEEAVKSATLERLNCNRARRLEINKFLQRVKDGSLNSADRSAVKLHASKLAIMEFYEKIDSLNI